MGSMDLANPCCGKASGPSSQIGQSRRQGCTSRFHARADRELDCVLAGRRGGSQTGPRKIPSQSPSHWLFVASLPRSSPHASIASGQKGKSSREAMSAEKTPGSQRSAPPRHARTSTGPTRPRSDNLTQKCTEPLFHMGLMDGALGDGAGRAGEHDDQWARSGSFTSLPLAQQRRKNSRPPRSD